jgi:hypothetical protein
MVYPTPSSGYQAPLPDPEEGAVQPLSFREEDVEMVMPKNDPEPTPPPITEETLGLQTGMGFFRGLPVLLPYPELARVHAIIREHLAKNLRQMADDIEKGDDESPPTG